MDPPVSQEEEEGGRSRYQFHDEDDGGRLLLAPAPSSTAHRRLRLGSGSGSRMIMLHGGQCSPGEAGPAHVHLLDVVVVVRGLSGCGHREGGALLLASSGAAGGC